jgi:aldehyde dehydrogenase (NAD(P)+)
MTAAGADATASGEADAALDALAAAKDRWASLPVARKLAYLDRLGSSVLGAAEDWVAAAVRGKRIPSGSPLEGEEWISGPYAVLAWIGAVRETLRAVAAGRSPLEGFDVWERPGGQVAVRVYPHGVKEQLLLHGYTVEVRMQPEVTVAGLDETVATFYRRAAPRGRVALVLGAGNIASIPPLDLLYKLFGEGEVALVKLNPINDYLRPVFERAFAPLIEDGYLRFVSGGGEVGARLCAHPGVESIHITGSAGTHDRIVYGEGEEGAVRRARDEPVVAKPISSELGGVGPTIVVPGPWRRADFAYQAEHIATQKLHNSGHNCVASQVLVLPAGWPGSDRLLEALRRRMLRDAEPRPAHYRGSEARIAAVLERYPQAETAGSGEAARVLVPDVDASEPYAFAEELFAPVLATTTLPASDPADFLRRAVRFCNASLHGTLGANLLIHPRTAAALGDALDAAIADLRYGCVAVNAWTGVGYLVPRATWGAFPGHTYADIQSGVGIVHNALLFDRPEKSVVRGPFRPFPRSLAEGEPALSPRPPWFVTNRTAAVTGRRLTAYVADERLRHFPGIFASALRG